MYAVVVLSGKDRDFTRFKSLPLAEAFLDMVVDKAEEFEIDEARLIHTRNGRDINPDKTKPKQKKSDKRLVYWCPYCGEWEFFIDKDANGYLHCRLCGVSTNDYDVKKYNHLWK